MWRRCPGRLSALAVALVAFGPADVNIAICQVLEPAPVEGPHLLSGDSTPEPDAGVAGQRSWQVQRITMAERPARIWVKGPIVALKSVRIESESGAWYAIVDCETGLCASVLQIPHRFETLPVGALPNSHMAFGTGRIARAWLAEPTQRMENSAIGPWVAGTLIVQDPTTRQFQLDLGLNEAFEDLRPRIAEVDGQSTLFVVRSSLDWGAALIAVRLEGEGLLRIAGETPPVGQPGGWLNPVGLGDFMGTGHPSIAIVTSPDQGGQLQILDFADGTFTKRFTVPGVSNHVRGRQVQDMAAIADFTGGKIAEIAIPDASRKRVRILSFAHGQVAEPADIGLPSPVVTEIAAIQGPTGQRPRLLMGLEDGELVLLH